MTIEEKYGTLSKATQEMAVWAYKYSLLAEGWPDALKIEAVTVEHGPAPDWPAAARDAMLAVLDEAFAQPVLVDSIYVARRGVDALRTRIQELGKAERN